MYGHAIKSMDKCISFQIIPLFLQKVKTKWYSLANKYLLTFSGHGSLITLEAIEQAQAFKLDMVTLLSHTFHALQPLDVACCKPFKIPFRKKRTQQWVSAQSSGSFLVIQLSQKSQTNFYK